MAKAFAGLNILGLGKKTVPTMHDLIEQESIIGGALFGEPTSRFWLHPPVDANEQVRDWYFSFVRDNQEYTIHYQTDARGIHKIYNGHKRPFTEGEAERFLSAVAAYKQRVTREVYGRAPIVRTV